VTLKGVASSDLGEVKKELTFKQVADNTMEGKMILTVGAQVVSGDLLATRPGPEPYSGSPGMCGTGMTPLVLLVLVPFIRFRKKFTR